MAEPLVPEEVTWARRGYADAQVLLGGPVLDRSAKLIDVGWYDSMAHRETGFFAVARVDGPYAELVGEQLRVTYGDRSVFVYCVDTADVPQDLSLYRHAFLRVALLARESASCVVEVVA